MKFAKLFCLFAGTITMAGCDDVPSKSASDAGSFDFNLYAQTSGNSASVCAVSAFPVESYSITLNGVTSSGPCVSKTFAESGVFPAQATLKYNGESVSKSISVNIQTPSGAFVSRKSAYGPILEPKASAVSSSDGELSMESMFGDSDGASAAEDKKQEEQQKPQEIKKPDEPKAQDKPADGAKKDSAAPGTGGAYSMPAFLQNYSADEETPKESESAKPAENKDAPVAADDKKEAEDSSVTNEVIDDKSDDVSKIDSGSATEGSGSGEKPAEDDGAAQAAKDAEKGPGTAATNGDGCYFSSTVNGWGFEKMSADPDTGLCSIEVQFSGSGDDKGPQRFKITDAADWNHRILGQSYVAPDRMCDIPSVCPDIEFPEAGQFRLVVDMKELTWSVTGADGKTYPVITDEVKERLERIKKIAEDAEKRASDPLLSQGNESVLTETADGDAQQSVNPDADKKVSDEPKSDEGSEEAKNDESAASGEKKDDSAASEDKKEEGSGTEESSGGDDGGSSDDDEDIGLDSLSW